MNDRSEHEMDLVAQAPVTVTEEQLLGALLEQEQAGCSPECRQEAAAMRETLADFRLALTELAGMAPALPAPKPVAASMRSTGSRWQIAASVSFATAATVLAASLAFTPHRAAVTPASPTVTQTIPTRQTALSDEALLDGIDQDLSTSVPPSLAPLAIGASASTTINRN